MVGLGPGAIGDVMSDSRRKSKDPAEGFAIGISVMLALGVIIEIVMSAISGEASIKSLWTYLEGIAAIYPFCFLIFLAFFGRSPRQSAKLAAWPVFCLLCLPLVPLAVALLLFVRIFFSVISRLILVYVKRSGRKDFAWGTGSVADMFTLKWWKAKGWRPPGHGSGDAMISSPSAPRPSLLK